ncbi:hypothetical protein Tco_1404196 [Tanacetum coccineum]
MGHSPEFAAPTKRFKWSAGSVDPLYNAMLVGMLYSGPENSIILRVKGVFNVSLKGLLKSSSSISFPFTMHLLSRSSAVSEGEFLLGRLDPPDLHLLWD